MAISKSYDRVPTDYGLKLKTIGKRTAKVLKRQKEKIYRRLFITAVLTIFLLVAAVFWGIQILVKFSEFLDFIQSRGRPASQLTDTIPPFTPRLESQPAATNSAKITLRGFAEAGTSVEVVNNGQTIEKQIVGNDGIFTISDYILNLGENRFSLKSIDDAGNESLESTPVVIVFDNTAPEIEIESPIDGQRLTGSQNRAKISGKTETGATITVNDFFAIVDQEGKFSYDLSLKEGENQVKVETTDSAGNKTSKRIKVFYSP